MQLLKPTLLMALIQDNGKRRVSASWLADWPERPADHPPARPFVSLGGDDDGGAEENRETEEGKGREQRWRRLSYQTRGTHTGPSTGSQEQSRWSTNTVGHNEAHMYNFYPIYMRKRN